LGYFVEGDIGVVTFFEIFGGGDDERGDLGDCEEEDDD
jgi:hypothetical protein